MRYTRIASQNGDNTRERKQTSDPSPANPTLNDVAIDVLGTLAENRVKPEVLSGGSYIEFSVLHTEFSR
jgi:hypothetical protein